jgi:cytochrome b6-f complex iron-sulfur subunit
MDDRKDIAQSEPGGLAGEATSNSAGEESVSRRDLLATGTSLAMAGGLLAGYGTLVAMAGRFLLFSGTGGTIQAFVAVADELPPGGDRAFTTPEGTQIVVTRRSGATTPATADQFLALSSICPHLGCRVHWEPQNDRFFCPCHNGAFDADGNATEGPPKSAGQRLKSYKLTVEGGLLFVEVSRDAVGSPAHGRET